MKAVAYDSRKATPGSVFVALKGQKADGRAFAAQALGKGATAVVAETPPPPDVTAPWIVVRDARLALARLAAAFYGHPSRDLTVVGITGTNGKTTTAYLVSALFEAAAVRCGMLGTIVYRTGAEERAADRTTPESVDVQQLLREMVSRQCGACAMEVSSHALALRRVDETRFAAAVFTNLTRDHLDFHGDLESYFAAKRRLFEMLGPDAAAVINIDDPRGASLAGLGGRTLTYAIDRPADIHPSKLTQTIRGLAFEAITPAGSIEVRSRLVGRPNIYNTLAAIGAAVACGLPNDAIARGIAALEGVPGRFQIVSGEGDDITVVVDYAHTDDALKNLLETARPLATARLITVFGAGGDRDRTKRPLMGRGRRQAERPRDPHVRQPAQRGPGGDHRGDQARRGRARRADAARRLAREPGEVHPADGDGAPGDHRPRARRRARHRARAARRRRADRGEGPREVPGDRGPRDPLRRRGGRPPRARRGGGAAVGSGYR